MKTILVVATLDTKAVEAGYIKKQVEALGAKTILLDGGVRGVPLIKPDITREEVAIAIGDGMSMEKVQTIREEAELIRLMSVGSGNIALKLYQEGKIHGIIGVGGGMGTAYGSGVMRALPIGVPKVMVTPQGANPDVVKAAVRVKDLCMYNAVSDVVGINRLTATIFTRAAGAVVGMANAEVTLEQSDQKTVTVCAKGTTEPGNVKIRQRLVANGFIPMTFHCWGYGPEAVEEVIKDGFIDGGVIEYASDWVDRMLGGSSYPPDDRYENAGKLGLPMVFVPGSCDFVVANAGTFTGRKVHAHNQAAHLFRTTKEELVQVGREVGEKLSKSKGPVTVVIPTQGFSGVVPIYDFDADAGFLEGIKPFESKGVKIITVDAHVDDDKFADAVIAAFMENVALAKK